MNFFLVQYKKKEKARHQAESRDKITKIAYKITLVCSFRHTHKNAQKKPSASIEQHKNAAHKENTKRV